VENVLASLELSGTPRVVVLNKSDRVEYSGGSDGESARLRAVRTSAVTGTGLDDLVTRMREELWSEGRRWPGETTPAAAQ
jgi:50S ribosomal subunit-associated GTPase HflX